MGNDAVFSFDPPTLTLSGENMLMGRDPVV